MLREQFFLRWYNENESDSEDESDDNNNLLKLEYLYFVFSKLLWQFKILYIINEK